MTGIPRSASPDGLQLGAGRGTLASDVSIAAAITDDRSHPASWRRRSALLCIDLADSESGSAPMRPVLATNRKPGFSAAAFAFDRLGTSGGAAAPEGLGPRSTPSRMGGPRHTRTRRLLTGTWSAHREPVPSSTGTAGAWRGQREAQGEPDCYLARPLNPPAELGPGDGRPRDHAETRRFGLVRPLVTSRGPIARSQAGARACTDRDPGSPRGRHVGVPVVVDAHVVRVREAEDFGDAAGVDQIVGPGGDHALPTRRGRGEQLRELGAARCDEIPASRHGPSIRGAARRAPAATRCRRSRTGRSRRTQAMTCQPRIGPSLQQRRVVLPAVTQPLVDQRRDRRAC